MLPKHNLNEISFSFFKKFTNILELNTPGLYSINY